MLSANTYVELLDGRSATLVGGNLLDLHDLDGMGAGAMAGSHIPVCKEQKGNLKLF